LKYYGDNDIKQCEIATWAWKRADWRSCNDNCCSNPDGCCNNWNYNWGKPGAIDDILKNVSSKVSVQVRNESNSISKSKVQAAISDGRPLIVRVNSGGHFIVIHGLDNNTLYYMDPWYGEGKGYQTFSTSQVNGRKWTHTQTCLTTPSSGSGTSIDSTTYNESSYPSETSMKQEISSTENVSVYPNPANESVVFRYEGQKYSKIKFVSTKGSVVKIADIDFGDNEIDISDLPKGIYYISFVDACTTNYYEKLIIE
jgi:hypothetical protein